MATPRLCSSCALPRLCSDFQHSLSRLNRFGCGGSQTVDQERGHARGADAPPTRLLWAHSGPGCWAVEDFRRVHLWLAAEGSEKYFRLRREVGELGEEHAATRTRLAAWPGASRYGHANSVQKKSSPFMKCAASPYLCRTAGLGQPRRVRTIGGAKGARIQRLRAWPAAHLRKHIRSHHVQTAGGAPDQQARQEQVPRPFGQPAGNQA
eukprot:SAG31_NODE_1351_length_8676_cov_3.112044_6_plen_208_part_00